MTTFLWHIVYDRQDIQVPRSSRGNDTGNKSLYESIGVKGGACLLDLSLGPSTNRRDHSQASANLEPLRITNILIEQTEAHILV